MKNLITAFLIFGFGLISAQTFEEKSASKACECLGQIKNEDNTATKEDINRCVSEGMDKTLKEMPEKEAKKKMRNMMAVVKMINETKALTISKCLRPKETETVK